MKSSEHLPEIETVIENVIDVRTANATSFAKVAIEIVLVTAGMVAIETTVN